MKYQFLCRFEIKAKTSKKCSAFTVFTAGCGHSALNRENATKCTAQVFSGFVLQAEHHKLEDASTLSAAKGKSKPSSFFCNVANKFLEIVFRHCIIK